MICLLGIKYSFSQNVRDDCYYLKVTQQYNTAWSGEAKKWGAPSSITYSFEAPEKCAQFVIDYYSPSPGSWAAENTIIKIDIYCFQCIECISCEDCWKAGGKPIWKEKYQSLHPNNENTESEPNISNNEPAKKDITNQQKNPSDNKQNPSSSDDKIHKKEPTDAEKLGMASALAAPGIIDAVDKYINNKNQKEGNQVDLGRPEGFYDSDPSEDEWVIKNQANSVKEKDENEVSQSQFSSPENSNTYSEKNIPFINPKLLELYSEGDAGRLTLVGPNSPNNKLTNNVNILIPGVLTGLDDALSYGNYVANLKGEYVLFVNNENKWEQIESDESYVTAELTYDNLKLAKNVNIIAHSGGVSVANMALLNNVQNRLDQEGKGYLMRNVTVVCLGAPEKTWETSADVIYIINPGDPVGTWGVNLSNHYFDSYKPWIDYIAKYGIDDAVRNQSKTLLPPPSDK